MDRPVAPEPAQVLTRTLTADRGRILAACFARTGDLDLAEDALQDAAISALTHWARTGIPDRPAAWLIRATFRKAIDRLRAAARAGQGAEALALLVRDEATEDPEMIGDDRLRLIFACCHPALEAKSRIALTLRSVCGLSTPAIAAAFLDNDTTMGQRLSRAKAKIAANRIGFAVPDPDHWAERMDSVLTVIYLIFNAGYSAGPVQGLDLAEEAVHLARMLRELAPDDPEVAGCLALILFHHARRGARVGADGVTLPPEDQDRSLWLAPLLDEGLALIRAAMAQGQAGPMRLKAAIAAAHVLPPQPDWPVILPLYDQLLALEPSPVVALNRSVAVMEVAGPAAALRVLDALADELDAYQPFHATLAEALTRSGNHPAALIALDRAMALTTASADALFLARRRDAVMKAQATH